MLRKQAVSPPPCRQLLAVRHVSYITNKEALKILVRRRKTSEVQERMDITRALTPIREYMGGFTRPTDLRIFTRYPGGKYFSTSRKYENPSAYAYEPHTVFLLESRYDVKYGVGRVDAPAHIVGICRTADFEAIVKMFNSRAASGECVEYMDNARWPWLKPKLAKRIKWWSSPEERQKVLEELRMGLTNEEKEVMVDTIEDTTKESEMDLQRKKDLRRQLAQTAAVAERVSEEQKLTLVEADIKSLQGKVPFEVELEDGRVEHPSGFEPPTPADKYTDNEYHLSPHPASKIAAALRRRQIVSASEHHSDPSPKVEQWNVAKERMPLMSQLTDGILAGGFEAATQPRDAKIPTEIHGVQDNAVVQPMQHASGFVPPTPKMARGETGARTHVVHGEHATTEPPRAPERAPIFASGDLTLTDAHDLEGITEHKQTLSELREQYFKHIEEEPFWRPLLTLTTSTRPLAQTLLRLSRGLPRGLPFHAVLDAEGRKSKASYAARMRSLRIDRMRKLATEMAQVLAGARGGLVGIRFGVYDRGRGVDGEGLDKPIGWKKRVIGVGVADWYPLADEVVESFELLGKEEVAEVYENDPELKDKGPFLVYKYDDWGKPTDGSPELFWPETDLMTDEIREGLQATRAVLHIERILDMQPDPFRMYVTFPAEMVDKAVVERMRKGERNSHWTDQAEVRALAKDLQVPIQVGFEDERMMPELDDGYVVLKKGMAKGALQDRLEELYRRYMNSIAAAKVMRGNKVLYPPSSTIYKEKGMFDAKVTLIGSLKDLDPKRESMEMNEEEEEEEYLDEYNEERESRKDEKA